jgi:Na+-transporting NADH:ubiquinone oxidoreductase subunit D
MKNNQVTTLLKDNIFTNNPILIQVLGICSTLAVTNNFKNTLIMCTGVIFVTALSNFTVSLIKSLIPKKVRMIVQVLIIAFYVIIVDIVLKAYLPDISSRLGPYVGLIITNCIIMGRAEAFAQSNAPLISFWDGLTTGIGYSLVLLIIAFIREILGFGTIYGYRVMPDFFTNWTIMISAPSGFFLLAIILWISNYIKLKKEKK